MILAARLVLAAVFAVAGLAKLADVPGSRRAAEGFGMPAPLARLVGAGLPVVELAVAVALVVPASARWAALAALALLLSYVGAISRSLAHGQQPDCHCFGQLRSSPAGRGTLVRNALLIVLAALVLVSP